MTSRTAVLVAFVVAPLAGGCARSAHPAAPAATASAPESTAPEPGATGARGELRGALVTCHAGDADACLVAGVWFEEGHGAPKNVRHARTAYETGCSLGGGRACALLGLRLERGEHGWPTSLDEAAAFYADACKAGEEVGCVGVGRALFFGWGGQEDVDGALTIWARLCQGGSGLGCATLAQVMDQVGRQREALALFGEACRLGVSQACGRAGAHGRGDGDAREPAGTDAVVPAVRSLPAGLDTL